MDHLGFLSLAGSLNLRAVVGEVIDLATPHPKESRAQAGKDSDQDGDGGFGGRQRNHLSAKSEVVLKRRMILATTSDNAIHL